MTRLLLLGDTQLGSGLDLGTGEYGPGSRFDDQVNALRAVVEIARREEVDAVIHLGDVFERPAPPPWQLRAVQNFVRDLAVPTAFLLGNHDLKSVALPHVLTLYDAEVGVYDVPEVVELGSLAVAMLPWAPMNRLAAGEQMSRADLKAKTVEGLVTAAQMLRLGCQELEGKTPILAGHWAVSGSTLPSSGALREIGVPERRIEALMDEPIIPWTDLDLLGFKLCVFGHIHQPQVIAAGQAETAMVYVGSPIPCNFGEAGSPHGVWIFDDAGEGELRFVKVPTRPLLTYDYNAEEVASLFSTGDYVPEHPFGGAIVRFRVPEGVDEAQLRAAALQMGASKVYVKVKPSDKPSRARVVVEDESVSPDAALELWLQVNDVDGNADALRVAHRHYVEALP